MIILLYHHLSRFLPSPVPFMMNVVYLQLFATNVQEPKWTQEPLIYDSKPYGNDGGLETAVYHNNCLRTIWLSHQAMFASGEWSIDNVLGDHRLSAALYKHKTASYGFSKELATCWIWQGEVPSPGKSLTDSITFVMQDSHCFGSITHRYLQLYSLQGLPWYLVPLMEWQTHWIRSLFSRGQCSRWRQSWIWSCQIFEAKFYTKKGGLSITLQGFVEPVEQIWTKFLLFDQVHFIHVYNCYPLQLYYWSNQYGIVYMLAVLHNGTFVLKWKLTWWP